MSTTVPIPDDITTRLVNIGLAHPGQRLQGEPLTGGVSSDIWRVDVNNRSVCIKRALERLRVTADWHAPIGRNRSERDWLTCADSIAPGCAPKVLGCSDDAFVMEWIDPATHPVWKAELLAGRCDPNTAAAVAEILVQIHARTAGDPHVAATFATDTNFAALRLDPYLTATAAAHPDLETTLEDLRTRTADTKLALVHGDVSPKNLLVGPNGPIFLDAECAWYGDPAFDIAFCTTHLLLKAVHRPDRAAGYDACARRVTTRWRAGVSWEDPAGAELRAATLVPALLLARVDGKSPVEYLSPRTQETVRSAARTLLTDSPERFNDLLDHWIEEVVGG
jgi:aminoglycoside phosphotransferase (APT) family kinase protein